MRGIIAVDGGGTKSEFLLVDELGNVLMRLIDSSSNPNDVGVEVSLKLICNNLSKLLDFAKTNGMMIEKIFLGIAGIEFGNLKDIFKHSLSEKYKDYDFIVDGDLASVIEAGLSKLDEGIVIISGTGFNMAIKNKDSVDHVGGRGYLADDYFSSFDLGKDALVYVSKYVDGIGDSTVLLSLIEKEFNMSFWDILEIIYKQGVKGVANLSKLVIKGYKDNDSVCVKIINSRVNLLVDIIKSKSKGTNVVLFGGLYNHNEFIVDMLKERLGNNYVVSVYDKNVVYGAVLKASKEAEFVIDDGYENNFDNSYKGFLV